MSARRIWLFSGAVLLTALAARRAHANRDPSELSVGGSTGGHDAHITCGPDVRVRHASGGVHYERLFESEPGSGKGLTVDFRGGVGTTVVTNVSDTDNSSKARALYDNEQGRTHVLATAQVVAGWDWRTFALRGGVGYFGLSALNDGDDRFKTKYYPLPALDMRIGRRSGWRGNLGLGAPPVPGLARWYSLYGIVAYRFKEGGEIGAGPIATFGGTLDQRTGVFFTGMFPITESLHVGGFAMVGSDEYSKFNGFNWTAGGAVRLVFDAGSDD
jgi:hypothetical protein